MEPGLLQPPSPGSVVWFSLICSPGGGSTAVAVTRDTVADESRKKMADGVARSSSRLCSRDGNILLLWRRVEYDFLACLLFLCLDSLVPTFRFSFIFFFFFLHPGTFIFMSLRLCSSHLLLSASTYSSIL